MHVSSAVLQAAVKDKILTIKFNVGDLPDSCGAPLSATSMAIVIIPNLGEMFNENVTFFEKKYNHEAHEEHAVKIDRMTGFLPRRREES